MAKILLRIPDDLHKVIADTGVKNRRSTNGEILRAIEYYLKNAPEAHYDPTIKQVEKVLEKPE